MKNGYEDLKFRSGTNKFNYYLCSINMFNDPGSGDCHRTTGARIYRSEFFRFWTSGFADRPALTPMYRRKCYLDVAWLAPQLDDRAFACGGAGFGHGPLVDQTGQVQEDDNDEWNTGHPQNEVAKHFSSPCLERGNALRRHGVKPAFARQPGKTSLVSNCPDAGRRGCPPTMPHRGLRANWRRSQSRLELLSAGLSPQLALPH